MRITPLLVSSLLLAACEEGANDGPSEQCDDLCTVLVTDCEYGAYPRYESCLQGCAWYEDQGADVAGELSCVQEADCDTFAIVECEHTYGMVEE